MKKKLLLIFLTSLLTANLTSCNFKSSSSTNQTSKENEQKHSEEHEDDNGGGSQEEYHDDPPIHSHEGLHYSAKSPSCISPGNKEFWACSSCNEVFLEQPEGSFTNATLLESLPTSHLAYLAPNDEHAGFGEDGKCIAGCGETIKDYYHLSDKQSNKVTLKDINLNYSTYTSLPDSYNTHVFGSYDYISNKGIDFIFDYSYEYNNKDSWFYFYLFNGKDESGVVIRLNTRANDGLIKTYVYQKSGYEGTVYNGNPSDTTNLYTIQMLNKSTSGFIHVKAEMLNPEINEFSIKLSIGDLTTKNEYIPEFNGNPAEFNVILGKDYFANALKNWIRFSNHDSNAKIKNHDLKNHVTYTNLEGDFLGSEEDDGSLTLPVLTKENYTFNGWKDDEGNIVTPSTIFDKNTILHPSFSRNEGVPIEDRFIIESGEKAIEVCDLRLQNQEYLTINYECNEPIIGKLIFEKETALYEDEFFLDNNETTFSMFLDVFRKNHKNVSGEKTLKSVEFTNVGEKLANFKLNNLTISDREYFGQNEYTIQDSKLKAGMTVSLGGGLSLLQNLNQNSVEYIDVNNEVKIQTRDKINSENIKKEIVANPNLINTFDHGREIQQSYYIDVDEENGYERGTYLGAKRRYNPVQSGDQYLSESRIIDYKIQTNSIYVKVQAVDWTKNNVLTKSYMTNTYSIHDGLLYVDNSFVDFYGFTNYDEHIGEVEISGVNATQELPALYTVHPLNYFSSCFTDGNISKDIFDNGIGWNTNDDGFVGSKTTINNINQLDTLNPDGSYRSSLSEGSYYYGFRKHNENWVGFANEDKFGLYIYMNADKYNHSANSNRHIYVGSTYSRAHDLSNDRNRTYYKLDGSRTTPSKSSFISSPIESCYVDNTNYITTMLGLIIREYKKFSWSYALGADYLSVLKDKFAAIQSSGIMSNDFTSMTGTII